MSTFRLVANQSERRLSDYFSERIFCKNNNGKLILKENSVDARLPSFLYCSNQKMVSPDRL